MIRAFLREKVSDFRARAVLPVTPRHDDLYLVEFPKSGVTWLSYLMANSDLALAGRQSRRATFFNLNGLVPDIHFDRKLAPPSIDGFGFRVIKSHAGFTGQYKRVFYLARDPRAVMASYFKFTATLGIWRGSLDEFVRSSEFGISTWIAHVDGWMSNIDAGLAFALIRYEDLLADTGKELRRLYTLLGVELEDAVVQSVIAQSGIDRMRADEALSNAAHAKLASFSFVRQGDAGGPRVSMPEATKAYIMERAGPTMQRLGYDI
jgi:hypothetical protein